MLSSPFCCHTIWLSIAYNTGSGDLLDSEKSQARHYRTLQDMYKSKKPNKAAVSHLLDLEFQSRRQFIVSDTLKEQDRPGKILDAYPCFRELDHVSLDLIYFTKSFSCLFFFLHNQVICLLCYVKCV